MNIIIISNKFKIFDFKSGDKGQKVFARVFLEFRGGRAFGPK